MGAGTLILSGLIVAPILVRRLGAEQYGIWALALSLIEYFWMIDIGVRPAAVKLTAEYKALEQWNQINRVLSTAAAYSFVVGMAVIAGFWLGAEQISAAFRITHPAFPFMLRLVSLSWGFGLVANTCGGAIEGFQRFDITNRIMIAASFTRGALLILLVWRGFGLREMSIALFLVQLAMYGGFAIALTYIYPQLSLSPKLVSRETWSLIWNYARQMILGTLSFRILQSAIPALIAALSPVRNVAYYSVTQRTLEYGSEGVGRIGIITAPRATDWMARGMKPQIIRMAEYANKYCLTMWLCVCSFLAIYGHSLFRLWMTPEFADQSHLLLLALLVGQAFWPGQFISGSILAGTGRFGPYSLSQLIEALIIVAGYAVILPVWGLPAAALFGSVVLTADRCFYLAWLFSREFDLDPASYLWRIYRTPLGLAAVGLAGLAACRATGIPVTNWIEFFSIGAIYATLYVIAAFFLVLEPDHQSLILGYLQRYLPERSPAA